MPVKTLITLLTDFGTSDAFASSMKGVILGINPEATIIDITHEIPPHRIHQAAFVLKSVYRYFPDGTIHVVVVDPGVGGSRQPLLLVHPKAYFVGPDNGVFSYIYNEKTKLKIYSLDRRYGLKKHSSTFDGRDLFAPVAAFLSMKVKPARLGRPAGDPLSFSIPVPRRLKDSSVIGRVIHTDRFGNLITNITSKDLRPWLVAGKIPTIVIKNRSIHGLKRFYAQSAAGELGAVINSDGHLELYRNHGSARDLLNSSEDEIVTVRQEPPAFKD
jgi:S-adenosylmethionine hydrolase